LERGFVVNDDERERADYFRVGRATSRISQESQSNFTHLARCDLGRIEATLSSSLSSCIHPSVTNLRPGSSTAEGDDDKIVSRFEFCV